MMRRIVVSLINGKEIKFHLMYFNVCSAEETWKWSKGLSDYRKWTSGEQQNNGDCVSISSVRKEMATQKCSARFPFICFKDNLVLVKENKTWEEALEHCRALKSSGSDVSYELVSVNPGEQHDYVITKVKEASTEQVGSCGEN